MSTRSVYTGRNKRLARESLAGSYKEFLQSDLWREIRGRVLKRDGGLCRICGEKATQIHHTNYSAANLSGRSIVGMFAICGGCHKFIEFKQDGTKAHLFKDVRKRIMLLAKLKGRPFIFPGEEKRPCTRCVRTNVPLCSLDDNGVCNRCRKREKAVEQSRPASVESEKARNDLQRLQGAQPH
jgi:hypothetical protein